MAVGLSVPMALGSFFLMFIAYFTVVKYIAASGFVYLFPVGVKGGWFLQTAIGTSSMSPRHLTAMGLINSSAFYGNTRIPALPALPHHFKMLDHVRRRRPLIVGTIFIAFVMGLAASCGYIIYLSYAEGGMALRAGTLSSGNIAVFDRLVSSIDPANRTRFHLAKIGVWLIGGAEVLLLLLLRGRFSWWPFHPLGLAFQYTTGPRIYGFSIFLVWLSKFLILRLGGISLYQKAKPFFYGMALGYAIGVGVSALVDGIWFPGEGHWIHGW